MTTLLLCLFDELRAVRVVAEDAFNHTDRANEIYLWGVFQAHWLMTDFVKNNFTKHPKLRPQMVMYILERMVPRM